MEGKVYMREERGDPGEWLLKRADIPPVSITMTSRNQGRNKFYGAKRYYRK
jgi:hypothetical protein